MAIGLIWRPLLRLSRQARQLPLLATSNQSIRTPQHRLVRDESHLFAAASQELADKLKAQRHRLLQQTHELKRLVQHDQLTGLNNRSMFEQSLQQTLGQLGRHLQSLALMFMDLNKFKEINDTMGHDQGDQLLQQVAMRLAATIRKSDVLARFGGDEFVILLPEPGGQHQLQLLADKLIDSVIEPIQLSNTTVQVGLSIGITTCNDPQCSISQLLREADTAMYAAKHSGSSCARFYHSSLGKEDRQAQALDSALAEALNNNQLQLQYQPMVNLSNDDIEHYQALITWPAAPEAIRQGAEVIQQLSNPKLQQQTSEWLLRQVLDTLDRVTVNQMPCRLYIRAADCHPELLRQLVLCCRRDNTAARRLGLLIDEQDYLDQFAQIQMELNLLYQAGVAIALDGFGNSLGALNQLSQMPPAMVRLDAKFCSGVSLQNGFTQSLILMLHKLNIKVVASGVSDADDRRKLQQLNCDLAQGPLVAAVLSEHKLISQYTASSHL
nr:sensor domain-containing diguanylate cyclase [Neiella litorisoli]